MPRARARGYAVREKNGGLLNPCAGSEKPALSNVADLWPACVGNSNRTCDTAENAEPDLEETLLLSGPVSKTKTTASERQRRLPNPIRGSAASFWPRVQEQKRMHPRNSGECRDRSGGAPLLSRPVSSKPNCIHDTAEISCATAVMATVAPARDSRRLVPMRPLARSPASS